MNKRYIFCFFCLALSLGSCFQGKSQLVNGIGNYANLPQAVYANPSFQPTAKYNIGIPVLSGIAVNHTNNWIQPSEELFGTNSNGETVINSQVVLDGINEMAHTGQRANVEILHVGVKHKSHYFRFSAAERASIDIQLPKDIFRLAVYGNVGHNEFENNRADFEGLNVDALHYREYVLGYSYKWKEKWQFGVAAKYLYGMERIKTSKSSLGLRTDPDTYELSSDGAFRVETAGIYGLTNGANQAIQDDISKYIFDLKNWGLAGDLGITFIPTEKWKFEASILDIGFIKWQSDVATYGTEDASFLFNGLNLTDIIFMEGTDFNDGVQDRIDSLVNVLEDVYGFERESKEFTTGINTLARVAAAYQIYQVKQFSGSAWLNLTQGLGDQVAPFNLALGYNQSFGSWLELGVQSSYRRDYPVVFGAGLVINAGPMQFYAMLENFKMTQYARITWQDRASQKSIPYFNRPDDLRLQFGFNLTFGEIGKQNNSWSKASYGQ